MDISRQFAQSSTKLFTLNKLMVCAACLIITSSVYAQDAAVEAVLELPRTEAKHYVESYLSLIDLGRPDLAEPIAAEILDLQLSDEQRAELVESVGAARLIRLARLAPQCAVFVEECLLAAESRAIAPERLANLVEQLKAEEPAQRIQALASLQQTGKTGINYCLNSIADTEDPKQAARLREALVALYPDSLAALLSALDDPDDTLRTQAAYGLGRLAELERLRTPLVAAMLARPALHAEAESDAARWAYNEITSRPIDSEEALRQIDFAIHELLKGTIPLSPNLDGNISWAAERGKAPVELTPRELAIVLAARLAKDRMQLPFSQNEQLREASLLEAEAARILGAEVTALSGLSNLTTYDLNVTLSEALEEGFTSAAIACCEELTSREDLAALDSEVGRPSSLVQAIQSPSADVRFAALVAIMQINPHTPYAGSSHVADALGHFATSRGLRRVVVAAPQLQLAGDLAGQIQAAGYQTSSVIRGFDAVEQAAQNADTEFVVVDLELIRPPIRETLFRLRRTPTTADLPIALLAPAGRVHEARVIIREHGGGDARMVAAPRIASAEGAAALLTKLEHLASPASADTAQRQTRALQAQEWIEQLIAEGPKFYRLESRRLVSIP